MGEEVPLSAIDDSLRHFKALSEALDERLRKREQQAKWDTELFRKAPTAASPSPPYSPAASGTAGLPLTDEDSALDAVTAALFGARARLQQVQAMADDARSAAAQQTHPQTQAQAHAQAQAQAQAQAPDGGRVRFRSINEESSPTLAQRRHNGGGTRPSVLVGPQPPVVPLPARGSQLNNANAAAAADYTSLLRSSLNSPGVTSSGADLGAMSPSSASPKARLSFTAMGTTSPLGGPVAAGSYSGGWSPASSGMAMQRSVTTTTTGSAPNGGAVLAGQVQYRALLAAAQAASRNGGARSRAFHAEMAEIDAEIDAYVGNYKFEQYAPDAALAVQTAWRARRARVFFNRYNAVRRKHLRRQLALAFGPLKQLVLAVLHSRRRMLRRAFEEWRDWVWLGNELFLRLVTKLRASIGSIKEHATPQQLWQLCTAPGGDPWAAKLTLGALVANVLLRQMPTRTLALYLAAWRRAVAKQVDKRQAAGEVLRRMERSRFWEYVRLLFRFWFRWSVIRVSERLQIAPPIFRPRIPEWDAWLFKHTRSRELQSRIVLLHKGFRVRHFFEFWLFFIRRNKRMRQAWFSTAAHHIEAILRNSINAFKANAAEARRLRRIKRTVFDGILYITRRNKTVRRIAKEVHEISRKARLRLSLRRLREWSRANRLLFTAASIQILARRASCLIPAYAMLEDYVHMWFMWCWCTWRDFTLGRLRMRCLLGLHLSRANTVYLEVAFKALRKWAELQRSERARYALQQMRVPPEHLLNWGPGAGGGGRNGPAGGGGGGAGGGEGAGEGGGDGAGGDAAAAVEDSGDIFATDVSAEDSGQEQPQREPSQEQPQQPQQPQQQHGKQHDRHHLHHPRRTAQQGPQAEHSGGSPRPGAGGVSAEASAAGVTGTEEDEQGDYELFVSLADYPLPPGGSWRSPLDKHEIMRRAAVIQAAEASPPPAVVPPPRISYAGTIGLAGGVSGGAVGAGGGGVSGLQLGSPGDAAATGISLGKMQEMLQQLVELDGPFHLEPGERHVLLSVVRHREVSGTQRSWVDVEHSVSEIFLSQGRRDPGLWQRLVGLLVCGVPHPDHPGAHLVDQGRLPLARQAAGIRRIMHLARQNLRIEPAAAAGASGAGAGTGTGGGSAPNSSSSVVIPAAPLSPSRRRGIILGEEQEETMLLHRLCEAEDYLDTCLHVLLGIGGGETMLLRRAMGSRVPRGTLLGDALVTLFQPALRCDLLTAAAELRHRTNRDRVITLGVDLADKARTYAAHRPEFTLTKHDPRGGNAGANNTAAARAAAAAAAIAARLTGGPAAAAAGASLEHGVAPLVQAALAPTPSHQPPSSSIASRIAALDDDEDMDALRARRRAAAQAQAEAAAVAAKAAAASGSPSPASPAPAETPSLLASRSPSPSRRWKTLSLSKSAVIRMEMLTGRPIVPTAASPPSTGNKSTLSSPLHEPPPTARASGSGVAPTPKRGGFASLASRIMRSPTTTSPTRGGRAIAFMESGMVSPVSGSATPDGHRAPSRAGASPSRRGSLRSMTSFASNVWARVSASQSSRTTLADGGSFSFINGHVGGGDAATALSDVSDPEGRPITPQEKKQPTLVKNFLHLTPPGFLSAGKVLNPANFPWPREVPSQDQVQMKSDFILRATLPNLAAMPQLPDIVFGPLGDPPGSQMGLEPWNAGPWAGMGGDGTQDASPEHSLRSHPSDASLRGAGAIAEGGAAGAGGSPAGGDAAGDQGASAFASVGGQAAALAAAAGSTAVAHSLSGGPADKALELQNPPQRLSMRSTVSFSGRAFQLRGATSISGRGLSNDNSSLPSPSPPKKQPSMLGRRSLYGPTASSGANSGMDREALAAAVAVRKERRTQALLHHLLGYDVLFDGVVHSGTVGVDPSQHLPGLLEGDEDMDDEDEDEDEGEDGLSLGDGDEEEESRSRRNVAAELLGFAISEERHKKKVQKAGPRVIGRAASGGLARVFGMFGVGRSSIDGEIGSDLDTPSFRMSPQSGEGGTFGSATDDDDDDEDDATGSSMPTPPDRAGGRNSSSSMISNRSSLGSRSSRRPPFKVTAQQLNIFMGGHLRRGTGALRTLPLRPRRFSGAGFRGLQLTADGIWVTPYGIQVIREVPEDEAEEEEEGGKDGTTATAAATAGGNGGSASADAAGTAAQSEASTGIVRRTKTVVVREIVQTVPFEEQYDFHKSLWLPPERRTNMLDGYDLAAELKAGTAGELLPAHLRRYMTPPIESPFLTELEHELARTRAQARRKSNVSTAERQRAWSRLSRGASVISRGSYGGSSGGVRPLSDGSGAGPSSPSRRHRRSSTSPPSRYGRNRYPIADSAFLSDSDDDGAASKVEEAPAPYMDDLFDDDYVHISAAAAAARRASDGVAHGLPAWTNSKSLRTLALEAAAEGHTYGLDATQLPNAEEISALLSGMFWGGGSLRSSPRARRVRARSRPRKRGNLRTGEQQLVDPLLQMPLPPPPPPPLARRRGPEGAGGASEEGGYGGFGVGVEEEQELQQLRQHSLLQPRPQGPDQPPAWMHEDETRKESKRGREGAPARAQAANDGVQLQPQLQQQQQQQDAEAAPLLQLSAVSLTTGEQQSSAQSSLQEPQPQPQQPPQLQVALQVEAGGAAAGEGAEAGVEQEASLSSAVQAEGAEGGGQGPSAAAVGVEAVNVGDAAGVLVEAEKRDLLQMPSAERETGAAVAAAAAAAAAEAGADATGFGMVDAEAEVHAAVDADEMADAAEADAATAAAREPSLDVTVAEEGSLEVTEAADGAHQAGQLQAPDAQTSSPPASEAADTSVAIAATSSDPFDLPAFETSLVSVPSTDAPDLALAAATASPQRVAPPSLNDASTNSPAAVTVAATVAIAMPPDAVATAGDTHAGLPPTPTLAPTSNWASSIAATSAPGAAGSLPAAGPNDVSAAAGAYGSCPYDDEDDEVQSEPSVSPSECSDGGGLRAEATLGSLGGRSAGGSYEQQREQQELELLRDEGVRRQLELLRAMWTSDPYSARPGVDPILRTSAHVTQQNMAAAAAIAAAAAAAPPPAAHGTDAAVAHEPVRIGAGLARALAEAEAEQWSLYDRAVEHVAREFARAMQQQVHGDDDVSGGGADQGRHGDAAAAASGPGASPSMHRRFLSAGRHSYHWHVSMSGAAAAGHHPHHSHVHLQPHQHRPTATPLTGHANRGLLDALEEALAVSLDPTALTGLSLEEYDYYLGQLVRRLVVAPAASKYMFWKKVQTVQQLRQKLLEDRAMADQLRGIAWNSAFNARSMIPTGTDPVSGRVGPFAREQVTHAEAKRRKREAERRKAHRALLRIQRGGPSSATARGAATAPAGEVQQQGGKGAAAGQPEQQQQQPSGELREELSLAPRLSGPAGEISDGSLAQLRRSQQQQAARRGAGGGAGGGLVGRRAAWEPLISPTSDPTVDGGAAAAGGMQQEPSSVPSQAQLLLQQLPPPQQPHAVEEQIVRPAMLQTKHSGVPVKASAREVRPKKLQIRHRRRPPIVTAAAVEAYKAFRDMLASEHPNASDKLADVHLQAYPSRTASTASGPGFSRFAGRGVGARIRGDIQVPEDRNTKSEERARAVWEAAVRVATSREREKESRSLQSAGLGGTSMKEPRGLVGTTPGSATLMTPSSLGGGGFMSPMSSSIPRTGPLTALQALLAQQAGSPQLRQMSASPQLQPPGSAAASSSGVPARASAAGSRLAADAAGLEAPTTEAAAADAAAAAAASAPGGKPRRQPVPQYMHSTASTAARAAGIAAAARAAGLNPRGVAGGAAAAAAAAAAGGWFLTESPADFAAAAAAAARRDTSLPSDQENAGASGGDDIGYGMGLVSDASEDVDDAAQPELPPGSEAAARLEERRRRRQQQQRPRLTAGKLQIALARRAALRAELEARGELLELDEMDVDELEEEAEMVDRLVEASIRVYGAVLAQRQAVHDGAFVPGGSAIVMPGEGLVMPGRGRALGWVQPGPHALGRTDAMVLIPEDPWVTPVSGTLLPSPRRMPPPPAPAPAMLVAPTAAGRGAAAANRLASGRSALMRGELLPVGMARTDAEMHLPTPGGQLKPVGLPVSAPLAPLAGPKPSHAAVLQPGNVRFPGPAGTNTGSSSIHHASSGAGPLRSSVPGHLHGVAHPLQPLVVSGAGSGMGAPEDLRIVGSSSASRLPPPPPLPGRQLPPVDLSAHLGHHPTSPLLRPGSSTPSSQCATPTTPMSSLGNPETSTPPLPPTAAASQPPSRARLDPLPNPPRPRSAEAPSPLVPPRAKPSSAGAAVSGSAASSNNPSRGNSPQPPLGPPHSGMPPSSAPQMEWVRSPNGISGLPGIGGFIGATAAPGSAPTAGTGLGLTGTMGYSPPYPLQSLPASRQGLPASFRMGSGRGGGRAASGSPSRLRSMGTASAEGKEV
ncbi:hypothetical protein Agub_g261 [Astrephomene gubernaculifera]|uniref:Uncharacterized protein n=1 Tax=Astrephomene gubernaculifera TaxID=47775 RepID=A0AAD3DDE3_9CHLO|nr:hypothetical protein Agub_g261 [Astrephomene gubernaculifera]